MKFKLSLIVLIYLISCNQVGATHLMGGEMGYDYLGTGPNNTFRYKIFMNVFRDCSDPMNAAHDDFAYTGVYENTAPYSLLQSYDIPLISVVPVAGVVGVNCPFQPNYCVEKGYYELEISLPQSAFGFHLSYIRCCRNYNIINIQLFEGQTYYTFIPPTNIPNSSARFNEVPLPYVCVSDVYESLSDATDPDGDSLVYSIVHPFNGGDQFQPRPQPAPFFDVVNNPPLIAYGANTTVAVPFGPNSYSTIDQTGVLRLFTNIVGQYIFAVQISEYRNGVLIGIVRRDVQIISLVCPPNPRPDMVFDNAIVPNGVLNLTIDETDTLDAKIYFVDPDSMIISFAGTFFTNASAYQPSPTFQQVNGIDTAYIQIYWPTVCRLSRAEPYVLDVRVFDKGCPTKLVTYTVNIFIRPTTNLIGVNGDSIICLSLEPSYAYQAIGLPNSTYIWQITNGNILNNDSSNIANINWNTVGPLSFSVYEVSDKGCISDTIIYPVSIEQVIPKVKVVSTIEQDPEKFELRFTNLGFPQNPYPYEVQYREATNANWDIWYNSPDGININQFVHPESTTKNYQFRVLVTDGCNKVRTSDIHTNIILEGERINPDQARVTWTSYQGWDNGILSEDILTGTSGPLTSLAQILSPVITGSNSAVSPYETEFQRCFRILAKELDGFNEQSFSNEICLGFPPIFSIPNAFTPNGDNLNNIFTINGERIASFRMEIYNRWGERIFETNSITQGWDGKINGKEAQQGTYAYRVLVRGGIGDEVIKIGRVSLIR